MSYSNLGKKKKKYCGSLGVFCQFYHPFPHFGQLRSIPEPVNVTAQQLGISVSLKGGQNFIMFDQEPQRSGAIYIKKTIRCNCLNRPATYIWTLADSSKSAA